MPNVLTKALSAFVIYGGLFLLILNVIQVFSSLAGLGLNFFGPKGDRIKVTVVGSQSIIEPRQYYVNAGQRLEMEIPEEQGFFVDGEYRGKALPPFTKKVYIRFQTPSGQSYRLSDWQTGFRAKQTGKIEFSVECEDGLKIWSGKGLKVERLSEFQQDKISIYIKKVGVFGPNVAKAKKVVPPLRTDKMFFQEGDIRKVMNASEKFWENNPTGQKVRKNIKQAEKTIKETAEKAVDTLKEVPEKSKGWYQYWFQRDITE
jgi:hypothetical protein